MRKAKYLHEYKNYIENYVVDQEIKKEILDIIIFFQSNGKITVSSDTLYGKIMIHQNQTYILEIKYDNFNFNFNYTESIPIFKKNINITQEYIKGGNHKINKQEKIKRNCPNNQNKIEVEEIEKIYNMNKILVHDSKLEKEYNYDTYENHMVYNGGINNCENSFSLEKNWYIENGSVIRYRLCKNFMNEDSNLYENYYICPKPYWTETDRVYKYVNLDEKLFKSFMVGEIDIGELLKHNNEKNKQKIKKI